MELGGTVVLSAQIWLMAFHVGNLKQQQPLCPDHSPEKTFGGLGHN